MKLILFAPELFLLLGCLTLFFLSTGRVSGRTARGTAIALALGTVLITLLCQRQEGLLFYEAYRIDFFSQFLKFFIAVGLAIVLLFSTELKGINDEVRPEYYLFLMLSTLGLLMLVSSVELITLFISLELSSYALYLLVPLRDDRGGLRLQMEAAIKYILFGVVATGIMLFGMSYIFGLTGTTYFVTLVPALQQMMASPVALVAILMFMGGLFFKLAVFPFHFWVPDVYQGASNETTAFIATVPKIAAVAVLVRIASLANPDGQALVTMLAVLAACSMLYGNLSALVQTDIKRMLGFSGIAHAGYVLLGLVTLRESGYAISLYYVIGYMLMTLAGFLVICKVSRQGENLLIDDLSGLYRRAPLLALTLAVSMFAMAGIPPFVGFMGKFMLLTGAYKAGHLALVIIAAINTAISIYYYLSVVRVAYTNSGDDQPAVAVDGMTRAVSVALVVIIIALGIAPNQLVHLATEAVRAIL